MGRGRRRRFAPKRNEVSYDAGKGMDRLPNSGSNNYTSNRGYNEIVKENAAFEAFYKAQNIVPEGEWDQFMTSLRDSLPCSFRISGCNSEAKLLCSIIESEYFNRLLGSCPDDSEIFEKPCNLPWYPEKLAWQLNLSRKCIRKSEEYSKLHNFLISETDSGNISRQEAVSMIPPLVLDVKPHHKVFDMCAAPGSKTTQLIEMLHADDTINPSGVIIANDCDNKRCYMLVHQAKRLKSPSLLITNHDASTMPNISLSSGNILKFDRILCDVPCSGDGTLRKNADIWKKWNVAHSANFHGLQVRILKRGLEMLSIGGKIVYSTCSLSPLEDESVIHHMLNLCEDSVKLVDISDRLPGLKYAPGLSHWKVMNRDLEEFASPDDVPEKNQTLIRPHMFPPSTEDRSKYNLQHCVRILPHQQNTGGFFVALLVKEKPLPWENSSGVKNTSNEAGKEDGSNAESNLEEKVDGSNKRKENVNHPARKKPRIQGYKEDPFVYLKENEELWPGIKEFFKLKCEVDPTLYLTRTQVGMKRTLYYTTGIVKEILTNNEKKLKVINTGIKVFHRSDKKRSQADFRLVQEGIKTVLPYMQARVVTIAKDDVITLLTHDFPFFNKLNPQTKEQLQSLEPGSIALIYPLNDSILGEVPMILCGWNGKTSVRAYLRKSERMHYLRLCGVDTTKYEKNKFCENENEIEEVAASETPPSPEKMSSVTNESTEIVNTTGDLETKAE